MMGAQKIGAALIALSALAIFALTVLQPSRRS